jgi:hypothetical protein
MIASRHIHLTALFLGMGGALGIAACSSSSSSGSSSGGNDSGVSGNDATGSSSGGGSGSSSGSVTDASIDAPPGPGASLACTSSGKNAWETYGKAAFVAVNESIFSNVLANLADAGTSDLGDAFTKIGSGNPPSTADNLATFKGNLAAFLVYAYGGPTSIVYTDGVTYIGPQSMTQAHAGLNITAAQYNYFVSNIIVPALTSNGVPMSDVSSCFAPVVTNAAFMASIVGQ